MVSLEIAVQDPAGAAAAAGGGADRVELCTALALGGLTPSLALIEATVAVGVPVHVLVRPREGNFNFSPDERALMLAEVGSVLGCGVAGVVVGATCEGAVDRAFVAAVRELAAGVEVTFHRAFDVVADRRAGLDELIAVGVDRVLTSGGASAAPEAVAELTALVHQADGRIQVMAGGGITSANVARVAAAGVDAVHSSAKLLVEDVLPVGLGRLAGPERTLRSITDPAEVRALRAALDRLR